MSRVQYNAKEKLAIIEEIDSGELGVMAVAYKYGISKTTLVKWRRRYEVYGALCEIAGIPRSSYYKWLNRQPSVRELDNQQLTEAMISLYEKVGGIYGYRRLTLHLRRENQQRINPKRIQRLMKLQGIQSVIRRKRKGNGCNGVQIWSSSQSVFECRIRSP